MHLLNQRKMAPAIARPPSGPSTCASLDGYDQRDAGGPITICHPVTGDPGWVPGAGILDRIKRHSGHRIRIRKPIHTRAAIAPPWTVVRIRYDVGPLSSFNSAGEQ